MITANATPSAAELASNIESGCGGLAAGLILCAAFVATLAVITMLSAGYEE